jgi:general secretion pathway protein J
MRTRNGFTLIELLVAMAIVAIIGVMAYAGLNQVIDQQQIASQRAQRWREVQLAMRIVLQDLSQLHPRPMRNEFGEGYLPSVVASASSTFALELSRGGWPNPAGFPRGNVARVAYDWEDDKLVRYLWPVMDRTTVAVPVRTELLDRVLNIEVQFYDGGSWYVEWPRAIEFALELEDYGRVSRIVETTG